jgi:hypothetical protein
MAGAVPVHARSGHEQVNPKPLRKLLKIINDLRSRAQHFGSAWHV